MEHDHPLTQYASHGALTTFIHQTRRKDRTYNVRQGVARIREGTNGMWRIEAKWGYCGQKNQLHRTST